MPSVYNLLPSSEKPISTRRRPSPLGLLELAFTSRVKFYGLAVLAGVSFQLLFGLVFSPSWRRVDIAPGLGGCAANDRIWVGAKSGESKLIIREMGLGLTCRFGMVKTQNGHSRTQGKW